MHFETLEYLPREKKDFMGSADSRSSGADHSEDDHVGIRIPFRNGLVVQEKIWLPFSTKLNRHTQSVASNITPWAIEHGFIRPDETALLDSLRRSRFETLTGLTCPDLSKNELEIVANLYVALFFLDDLLDDKKSVIGQDVSLATQVVEYLSAAIADQPTPDLPSEIFGRERVIALGSIFRDVTLRLSSQVRREQLHTYLEAMHDYFWGCVAEITSRSHLILSLEEYARIRQRCSAVYPAVELGVLVRGQTAPREFRDDESFATMLRTTNLCVSYVNDIFSYEKEAAAGESTNLVAVTKNLGKLTTKDAVSAAARIVDQVIYRYVVARQDFLRMYSHCESAWSYSHQMETWMRGNLDWYNDRLTDRYVDCLTTARPS